VRGLRGVRESLPRESHRGKTGIVSAPRLNKPKIGKNSKV